MHCHDLCVQKWSSFRWSSDAFRKFSPCEVDKKSAGRINTIFASKNEAICCEVQTHWKFSACKVYRKSSGRMFTIYASKSEAVYCKVQTQFGSSPPARFTEKVLGTFLWFMCPKTKLSTVKFRRIQKLSFCKVYEKLLGAISRFMRLKRSCLPVKLMTQFGVLRLQGVQKEVLGAFSRFVCHANRHSWLQNFVKMLWARFTILHTHTFLLCCWDTLWSSWLSHFIRMLLSLNTFKLQVHPQIVTGRCVFVRSTFKEVLDWHLRHVL